MIEINDNDYKISILNFTTTIIQLSDETNSVNENNSFTYQLTNTSNIVDNAKIIYGDLIVNNKINLTITDTLNPPNTIYNLLIMDILRLKPYAYVIKDKKIYNINNNIFSIKKQINDNVKNYKNCNWLYKGAFEKLYPRKKKTLYPRKKKTKKKINQYLTAEINNTYNIDLILSLFYIIIFQGILSDITGYIVATYSRSGHYQTNQTINNITPIVIINFDAKYVLKINLVLIHQLNINQSDTALPALKYVYLITYGFINNDNEFIKIFIYDPSNDDKLLDNYKYIKGNAFSIFKINDQEEHKQLTNNYNYLLDCFEYIYGVKHLNNQPNNTSYSVNKQNLFNKYVNLFHTNNDTDYSFFYNSIIFININ